MGSWRHPLRGLFLMLAPNSKTWSTGGLTKSENLNSFLPTVVSSQPTGRFWQEKHGEAKEDSWQHLQTPWDTESSSTVDERATIRDIEHDQDTPGDCPLLTSDKSTTLGWWCDFGDVDGNLSRADTDGETVDDTANDQHGDVLRSTDDD
jgi:hypothetical protein